MLGPQFGARVVRGPSTCPMAEKSGLSTGVEKFPMLVDARTQLSPRSPRKLTVRSTIQSSPITLVVRKRAVLCLAKLRRLVNGWVAVAISRHAHRAALPGLSQFDERALNDVGPYAVMVARSQGRRLGRCPTPTRVRQLKPKHNRSGNEVTITGTPSSVGR